jgi:hypothetical protein
MTATVQISSEAPARMLAVVPKSYTAGVIVKLKIRESTQCKIPDCVMVKHVHCNRVTCRVALLSAEEAYRLNHSGGTGRRKYLCMPCGVQTFGNGGSH